jgi:hypothetical protein
MLYQLSYTRGSVLDRPRRPAVLTVRTDMVGEGFEPS